PIFFFYRLRAPPRSPLFPYTTLFRSQQWKELGLVLTPAEASRSILTAEELGIEVRVDEVALTVDLVVPVERLPRQVLGDRRSLRSEERRVGKGVERGAGVISNEET